MNIDKVNYATLHFVLNINHKNLQNQIIKNWKNSPKSLEKISICVFSLYALSELGFNHIKKIINYKYIILKK
jgi:hypothetical protein